MAGGELGLAVWAEGCMNGRFQRRTYCLRNITEQLKRAVYTKI